MEKYIKNYIVGLLSIVFIVGLLSFPVLAESQIYVVEDSKKHAVAVIEGQYFDEQDPKGIGEFTEEEIQFGLDKSDLACKVIAIRDRSINQKDSNYNIASKSKKPINAEDIATIMEYIEKYTPEANLSDYIIEPDIAVVKEYISKYAPEASVDDLISEEIDNISPTAVGDYTSKNLNLPGQVQKYDNYCAPASIYAVLKGKGLNVDQDTLASYCGISPNKSGTYLDKVAPTLNRYNKSNGGSNLSFFYATLLPKNVPASQWNVRMADAAIATIVGNYGVVYDVHQVKGSPNYLQGYETMVADNIYHYVAGEGFNANDPSRRICLYYDSNNLKSNLGTRHMNITFQVMGVLTNDMGLVY